MDRGRSCDPNGQGRAFVVNYRKIYQLAYTWPSNAGAILETTKERSEAPERKQRAPEHKQQVKLVKYKKVSRKRE